MPLPRVIPRETSKEGAWYRHRKQPTSKDLPNSAPFFRWLRSSPSSNENESDIEREQLLFVKNIAAGNSQVRKRLREKIRLCEAPIDRTLTLLASQWQAGRIHSLPSRILRFRNDQTKRWLCSIASAKPFLF